MRLIDADALINTLKAELVNENKNIIRKKENRVIDMRDKQHFDMLAFALSRVINAPKVIGKCAGCKCSKVLWNDNDLVWCNEHDCIMSFDSFCSQWKDGNKYD